MTTRNCCDCPEPSSKIRVARLHDSLRKFSVGRTRDCRRKRIAPSVQIQRTPDGSIKMQGICTCGSPWGCPSCAVKIYTERATQVTSATTQWRDSGGYVYMMTNTLRHAWGDDLRLLRTGLSKSVSRMWQGRAGQALMQRIKKAHHIRSIEVTHGENGFHPHVHTLLFLDRELTDVDRSELGQRWQDAVSAELGSRYVPDTEHGTTIDDSHRTDYISKLGLEVAAITTKSAKNGNRTMWTIAADAADGDKASAAIWSQYVRAMFGCRQLFWSKGAKQAFGINRLTDEEIVQDVIDVGEPLGVATVLAQWQGKAWDNEVKHNPFWLTKVVAETLQGTAAMAALPGQDPATPEGHIPIQGLPLHPVPWRRDQQPKRKLSGRPIGDEGAEQVSATRLEWLNWCREQNYPTIPANGEHKTVASVSNFGPEYLTQMLQAPV